MPEREVPERDVRLLVVDACMSPVPDDRLEFSGPWSTAFDDAQGLADGVYAYALDVVRIEPSPQVIPLPPAAIAAIGTLALVVVSITRKQKRSVARVF